MFDVTNKQSFKDLDAHLFDIKRFSKDPYIVLVGAKCDLDSQREISFEMGKEKAEEVGIEYIETSSKLSINVEEVFLKVASEILFKKSGLGQ